MIIGINDPKYIAKRDELGKGKFNGAYYYAREIENNMLPLIKPNKMNWVLVNNGDIPDNSIVFIHTNFKEGFESISKSLKGKKNLVLVCSIPETEKYCRENGLGETILLPMSVDVDYVKKFRTDKSRETALCGNLWAFRHKDILGNVEAGTHILADMPRDELLAEMAKYKRVYATDRVAMEATILGCEVLYYDTRYPKGLVWPTLDNKDAAKMLDAELDKISSILR